MKRRLVDLTSVIRSKNSGPYELTLDIIFIDRQTFERVCALKQLNEARICALYKIKPEEIINIVEFIPANAIKITIKRPVCSGEIGETDVYGAQQHAPLLGVELDL